MKSDEPIDISNGVRRYKPCEIHQRYCYTWRKLYEQEYFNDFGKTVDEAIKEIEAKERTKNSE